MTTYRHEEKTEATRYCTDSACPCGAWQICADERAPDTWHIASPDAGSYRIAASGPICPRCGGDLAPHPEGVGAVAGAGDNPFVDFLHDLNKAEARDV